MDTRNTNSPDPGLELTPADREWIAAVTSRRLALATNLAHHAEVTSDDLSTTLRTLRRLAAVDVDRAFTFPTDGSGNPIHTPNEKHRTWSDASDLKDRLHTIHAWVVAVYDVRTGGRARSERGAAGWGAVAVWTLLTSLCVGVWALITNGVLSAVGIDTWIALLNVIEVGGYLLGAYAAVCLLLYLTRPAPLDAHLPRRDERGASNIGLLVAGVLVFAVGILFATVGRA